MVLWQGHTAPLPCFLPLGLSELTMGQVVRVSPCSWPDLVAPQTAVGAAVVCSCGGRNPYGDFSVGGCRCAVQLAGWALCYGSHV